MAAERKGTKMPITKLQRQETTERITRAYFAQGAFYASASHTGSIEIATMYPGHAANAAEKLLRDAPIWASQAGVTDYPHVWMARQRLFRALATRGDAS